MSEILIINGKLVNEGKIEEKDILIRNGIIEKIGSGLSSSGGKVIDAKGKIVIPGVIDDQVHFREPGLTNKATIYTESKATVAGGVTSFMEMPNTVPNATTIELLEAKYSIASESSLANYSFYMGATNDNLEEVQRVNPAMVCGIKIFMGSSTGNMLVNDPTALEKLFSGTNMLIATHCEDEETILKNSIVYKEKYGENVPWEAHAEIRSAEACYKSSSYAVELAKKFGTRLHVLHISTENEIGLFSNQIPLSEKKITSEVCVHHLWFDKNDYAEKGACIKWNPAVKDERHKLALVKALQDDYFDVVATDHAPHTLDEKNANYWNAPSGGPLIQHSLVAMLEFYHKGELSLEKIVEKMCHNPAILFRIKNRGFIREGYKADIAIVDLDSAWEVAKDNILYKCKWSPFEGYKFKSKVTHTIVSGQLCYEDGVFDESVRGERLNFYR
jgi:dihydroorotase